MARIRDELNAAINWFKYYLLPTVIYANLPSKERKNDILTRLQLLENDDWTSFKLGSLGLREDYRGRNEAGNDTQREAYAMKFAKAGEIAKCLSTISSKSSRFPVNESLFEAIQRKHPRSEQSFLTDEEINIIQNPHISEEIGRAHV